MAGNRRFHLAMTSPQMTITLVFMLDGAMASSPIDANLRIRFQVQHDFTIYVDGQQDCLICKAQIGI